METLIILAFTMFAVLPFAAEGLVIYFRKQFFKNRTKKQTIKNKKEKLKMETLIILGFTMFAVLPFAAEGLVLYFRK